MTCTIDRLVDMLHLGNHSLVIANDRIATFDSRGVAALFHVLNNDPALLSGAIVADKVVGKGAAALMIAGNVKAVHADVISHPALEFLASSDIEVRYGMAVDNIINRRGDGICPVESLCLPCSDAVECIPLIAGFLSSHPAH